ncbi:membrane bound O-acyl transferase family-domain-containing protein [Thelephora terrestris]|uniref:Membrane bound O-acyl transferase family-domain-containing protein n=1 Tax=Thelephora terrestris TaxID=56493 RepID=A0A9P6L2S6_9AGAM|nr:membrane bound O-acyl transferase family-domain-containing protein [Thelephora terrestris]
MGQFPWTTALLFEALRITILYPTRHHAFRVVAFAAMIYVAVQVYLTMEASRGASYTIGISTALHLGFTTYLLCGEGSFPDHWRRVRDQAHAKSDAGGSENLPSNFSFMKKLWWTIDLAYSVRMIGWVQEPQDLPTHPPPSRRTFLWNTSLKFIVNLFLVPDLTTLVIGQSPAFDSRLHDPTDGPETYLAAVPLLRRVPYVVAFFIFMGSLTCGCHNLLALVCVGLGGSSPTLWPDNWGSWGDAYTIRRFWRKTWHQRMRPTLAGWGGFVANKIFKFPRGSNRSSYTKLYVGFFLFGIIHLSGDFMCARRMIYDPCKFFLLQPIAITFEDFVIYLAKRSPLLGGIGLGNRTGAVVRVAGYCWVMLWLCLALPVLTGEQSTIGFNDFDRGPIARFLFDKWKQYAVDRQR